MTTRKWCNGRERKRQIMKILNMQMFLCPTTPKEQATTPQMRTSLVHMLNFALMTTCQRSFSTNLNTSQ
eukprot:4860157-Karenia_brevis.AAC.1